MKFGKEGIIEKDDDWGLTISKEGFVDPIYRDDDLGLIIDMKPGYIHGAGSGCIGAGSGN